MIDEMSVRNTSPQSSTSIEIVEGEYSLQLEVKWDAIGFHRKAYLTFEAEELVKTTWPGMRERALTNMWESMLKMLGEHMEGKSDTPSL